MITLTIDEFIEKFKPIKNPIRQNACFDGCKFEIDGKGTEEGPELSFVRKQFEEKPNSVWTISEVDGEQIISSGWSFVNRDGYLITEVEFEGELQAFEQTVTYSIQIELEYDETVDPSVSDVKSFAEEMFDNLHETQYTVSREEVVGEDNKTIGDRSGTLASALIQSNNDSAKTFVIEWKIKLYADDVDENTIETIQTCLEGFILEANEEDLVFKDARVLILPEVYIAEAYSGTHCPFCGSDDIESDNLEADGLTAEAECTCNHCGKEWTDTYEVTGYSES